jgi:hypothetical protein
LVTSLRIIYDVDGSTHHHRAVAMQQYAPPDFEVSIAPFGDRATAGAAAALGDEPADVVFLLPGFATREVVDVLRRRRWSSRLVVGWSHSFPHRLGEFYAVRHLADAWIFNDRECWIGSGQLPRTVAIANGGDLADWIGEHFARLREVLDPRPARPTARPDLSSAVTVFVTTVGGPTIDTCLTHLREQDCAFALRVIDGVAPMDAAFQRMLDECQTPYYVQVDEDMLLYPHAVRTLHESMAAAPPDVAVIMRNLYDVHLERCIFGVKIFRHEIVRRYPLRAMEAFEVDQVQRFEADGYRLLKSPAGRGPLAGDTLGVHGTQWTPETIYERYANLQRRLRGYPHRMQWFVEYGPIFLRRFLDDPSDLNALALLGVMAGQLAAPAGPAKDYRTRGAVLGCAHVRAWLDALRDHAAARTSPVERGAPAASPTAGPPGPPGGRCGSVRDLGTGAAWRPDGGSEDSR